MASHFITIEGPDGAGKTSVINALMTDLKAAYGDQLVLTREPGGNRISESIRDIVLGLDYTEMDARTEALLFAASRRQHIVETIEPALKEGKIVISDRYIDSSVAYQGGGREIGAQAVWDMNLFATDGLMPELTIYLDIESELGLRRIATTRQNEVNRLDKDALEFHKRVRQTYLELQQREPDRIKTVDAARDLEEVVKDTKRLIENALK